MPAYIAQCHCLLVLCPAVDCPSRGIELKYVKIILPHCDRDVHFQKKFKRNNRRSTGEWWIDRMHFDIHSFSFAEPWPPLAQLPIHGRVLWRHLEFVHGNFVLSCHHWNIILKSYWLSNFRCHKNAVGKDRSLTKRRCQVYFLKNGAPGILSHLWAALSVWCSSTVFWNQLVTDSNYGIVFSTP